MQEKFTDTEKDLFFRMVNYYLNKEQEELKELLLPSGSPQFISEAQRRLEIFSSIKRKVEEALF